MTQQIHTVNGRTRSRLLGTLLEDPGQWHAARSTQGMNRKRIRSPVVSPEPPPPRQRKHGETRAMLITWLQYEIESSQAVVAGLAAKLAASDEPAHDLAWSSQAIEWIARLSPFRTMLHLLTRDENPLTIAGLVSSARRELTRLASRASSQSTSPMSNYVAVCELTAWAYLADQLSDWADGESQEVA